MFGIDDKDLMDQNKIKVLNGIAGSGKSTSTVNELRRLGSTFCLASFSNALKFAASDKFGCPTETICGLEFVNTPFPRSGEKDIEGFDTVVNDEILLDGVECIEWMINHVGKVNIIALTDSRQMLNADNGKAALKKFEELINRDDVVYVEIDQTKRARDAETKRVYKKLYGLESNAILDVDKAAEILKCDVVEFKSVSYDINNTYLCHSNAIEHEIYKKFGLSDRKDIPLIPKNHISRLRNVDVDKYPICDQITADTKKVCAYLQAANVATPTRFQGKEVEVKDTCYFVVKKDDLFTGREIYTVGTRCQSIKSLHIAIIDVEEYKDPDSIYGRKICQAKRLNIDVEDKTYKYVSMNKMVEIIKEHGQEGVHYLTDVVISGDNIVYSTMSNSQLCKFATIEDGEVKLNKMLFKGNNHKTIRSIVKKDPSMHFDYMPKVYDILKIDVTPPRINNRLRSKKDYGKLCDIYSAFPTMLKYAVMPKAGYIYESYDPELLNWYIYEGDKVTKCSLITEELAEKLGDSRYMFSTEKQIGCALGEYTYTQSRASKEKKKRVNENFLWGKLESGYYTIDEVVVDGSLKRMYTKHPGNNLELVACALWSKLCLVMLEALESVGDGFVVTDGLYYNGDVDPVLPDWCDYRIEVKHWDEEQKSDEKYVDVIMKTYEEPKTAKQIRSEINKRNYAKMTEEQREAKRARDREYRRAKRAAATPHQNP